MNESTSYVSRYVAFAVQPIATALATLVALKAKSWFGVDLDPAEIVTFILSISGTVALWLYNRGRYEIKQATGLTDPQLDHVIRVIEERLPARPTAPAPGAGSPQTPRAPGV